LSRFRHDVVIVGGGPAGAAAATALAGNGLAVALFTHRRGANPLVGETVPPSIMRPLVRLGLWERFVAAGHRPSPGTVVSWGKAEPFENEFIASSYGMGWHLDRERFDNMLLCAARAAGADVNLVTAVDGLDTRAPWLIDATGRASWLARRQGVRRRSFDRQVALVRFGSLECSDDRMFIEARPGGWWYAAALPGDRVVAAYFTDSDLLPPDRAQAWDRLLRETELVSGLTTAACDWSAVRIVAASSGCLSRFCGPGWMAIGDAALCYDPCSGQGLTKALQSALDAAAAIAAQQVGDPGAVAAFAAATAQQFRTFIDNRRANYRREQRWTGSAFWQRRHAAPAERSVADYRR
jgi:flavin-dependent dehydrogenase